MGRGAGKEFPTPIPPKTTLPIPWALHIHVPWKAEQSGAGAAKSPQPMLSSKTLLEG